jgi:transcriptional regulator with XRE-family HTH domain
MPTLEQIFARNIKRLRAEKGLTQDEVAEAIGVERVTYQNYEAERRRPKKEIIPRLAAYFGVDQTDLYKDPHKEPRPQTFAETIKVSRLMTLLDKKVSNIPDDVYEMAQKFPLDHDVWEHVRGCFDEALEAEEERARKENG